MDTGIILRRNTKANLIGLPPVVGEMVFATDTGEHGWLNRNGVLIWKNLNGGMFSIEPPTHTGVDGEIYMQLPSPDVVIPGDAIISDLTEISENGFPGVHAAKEPNPFNFQESGTIHPEEPWVLIIYLTDTQGEWGPVGNIVVYFVEMLEFSTERTISVFGKDIVLNGNLSMSGEDGLYKIWIISTDSEAYGDNNPDDITYIHDQAVASFTHVSGTPDIVETHPFIEYVWYDGVWNTKSLIKIVSTLPTTEQAVNDTVGTVYLQV